MEDYLGLEAAKAMIDLGISDTQVIEFAPRLMPRQIDGAGSNIIDNQNWKSWDLQSIHQKIHQQLQVMIVSKA